MFGATAEHCGVTRGAAYETGNERCKSSRARERFREDDAYWKSVHPRKTSACFRQNISGVEDVAQVDRAVAEGAVVSEPQR